MVHQMSNRAVKLANALLKHHRQFRRSPKNVNQRAVENAIIEYKHIAIKEKMGNGRGLDGPLGEIAEWCDVQGWPPLNALVVNKQTHEPGPGYDGAGNFQLVQWPYDVRRCIGFGRYPKKV